MKIVRMLAVLVGLMGAHVVGTAGDEVVKYSSLLNTFCPLLSDSVKEGSKPGAKSSRAQCKMVVTVGMETGAIANEVEKFKDKDLPMITKKGDELIDRLQCMASNQIGNPACKALGCTSDNACVALILKDTKDLLEPVMTTLVAGQTPEAKKRSQDEKKAYYDTGALYRLASLSALPAAKSIQAKADIAAFAERINGSLEFMTMLASQLSPQAVIAASPELPAEKKAELAKVEPLPQIDIKAEAAAEIPAAPPLAEPMPITRPRAGAVVEEIIPTRPRADAIVEETAPALVHAPAVEKEAPGEIPVAPLLEGPIPHVTPREPMIEQHALPAAPGGPVSEEPAAAQGEIPMAPPLEEGVVPGVAGKGMMGSSVANEPVAAVVPRIGASLESKKEIETEIKRLEAIKKRSMQEELKLRTLRIRLQTMDEEE